MRENGGVSAAAGEAMGGPRRVLLAGDWHGAGGWAETAIAAAAAAGIDRIYHVGDFGVWPGDSGAAFRDAVSAAATQHGVELWVTPGNHEDWDALDVLFARHGDAPAPYAPGVLLLPRGHRWVDGGRSWLSLGGAPTLSFEHRTRGVDWWPNEELSDAHVDAALAAGPAEVMISHDAPEGTTKEVADTIATNPFGFSATALEYAARGRARITRAFHGIRPALLAHGHYHVSGELEADFGSGDAGWHGRVVSLDREARAGNLRVLDTATLEVAPLPIA